MAYQDNVVAAESGGDPNMRDARSSAAGAAGFIDSTWIDMLAKNRPDLVQGKSRDELIALKSDPQLSRDMTAAYAAENGGILAKAGLPVTPGTQYLAHFAGPKGAVGLLSADPSLPAGSILGQAAVKANPFLANMTAGDVVNWASKKMGARAPMSMAGPAASAPAAPVEAEQPAPAQPQAQVAAAAPIDTSSLMQTPQLAPLSFRPRISLAQAYGRRTL